MELTKVRRFTDAGIRPPYRLDSAIWPVMVATDAENLRSDVDCRPLRIYDECRLYVGVALGIRSIDSIERENKAIASLGLLNETNLNEIGEVISSRSAGDSGSLIEFSTGHRTGSLEERRDKFAGRSLPAVESTEKSSRIQLGEGIANLSRVDAAALIVATEILECVGNIEWCPSEPVEDGRRR